MIIYFSNVHSPTYILKSQSFYVDFEQKMCVPSTSDFQNKLFVYNKNYILYYFHIQGDSE